MASNKSGNTSLPHANRPKVPTDSSRKCLAPDESSMRRNLKRPVVESSELGDDNEGQDPIFSPWRSLSNPPHNIDEEFERLWTREATSSSEDAAPILTNEESSYALLSKDQVETKKSKNKQIEFMFEELRSLRLNMDGLAMAIKKGNLRSYTEEQLYDEITKITTLSKFHTISSFLYVSYALEEENKDCGDDE
ncbi:hypothetical protein Cgig2_025496 [Carnegiea gigantea]|uniref:Uncharacterized protein n=1 Tax=Carnegiea gigantea TaxID=171969 RepID=A0A9Q1JJX7_9CARY|nr:hypothetical protein Cgig2_025496 [Carnegiea gigantea]